MSCNYFFHELSADSFSLTAPQTIVNVSTQWGANKMGIFGLNQEVCADDFDFDFDGDDEFDDDDDLDDELEDLSDFYNDEGGEYSYDIEDDDEDFYDDDLDD